jgi:hypothetical protein
MASSHKKVIVRRFLGDVISGYLPMARFVRIRAAGRPEDRVVELLDLSGRILSLSLAEIKYICFVRDFNLTDSVNPERLTRRTFLARPRTEGLWLRLTFRTPPGTLSSPSTEAEQFEGLAPLDLAFADDLVDDAGLFLIPPDIRSNTQRLYIPRTAFTDLQLLAVITTPSRRKPEPGSSALQEDLFHSLPTNSRPN